MEDTSVYKTSNYIEIFQRHVGWSVRKNVQNAKAYYIAFSSRDSVVGIATGVWAGRPEFRPTAGDKAFFFSETPRHT
jgi:hypothetical protein